MPETEQVSHTTCKESWHKIEEQEEIPKAYPHTGDIKTVSVG